ncbi:MAG: SusD/RagB family nutrient-binding outer membrane lipoprotein [Gemmatimonadales bacterium]
MRQSFKAVLGLALALSAAGCSDYLSGPGVDQDPNNVINLQRAAPLYVGIQAAGPVQREGQLARWAVLYMQQGAGIARQQADFDLYGATQADADTYFGAVYGTSNVVTGGGGLLDIHKVQQIALAAGDSLYVGIAKVYEALYIGYAADLWGDIPYREAADSTIRTPAYDPQLQVYADLQAQLDEAITIYLAAAGPTNQGPAADGSELIYGGRTAAQLRAVYTAVAHSLKARLYLHVAEVQGQSAYAAALAQVPLGISTPADDFLWFHDLTPSGRNIWWQFENSRAGDLGPGAALVEILKDRIAEGVETNNRLAFYFTTANAPAPPAADGSNFVGYRPGFTTGMPTSGGIFNGTAAAFSTPAPHFGGINEAVSDFRAPEITYAETQLIGAEAALLTGDAGLAQTYLNNARTNRFFGSLGGVPVGFGTAPGVLAATLENIIEEKYTTLFLNPEVWNDYKRTCFPSLAPAPTSTAPGSAPRTTQIPGRVPYGQSELSSNPNAPDVSATGQNPNDPNACPALNYTSSTPLAN